ncbi:MAG: S8 family serine peptidase [Mycobacterium sp.]
MRPAYSAVFSDTGLVIVDPLDKVGVINPDWAWGGSSGAGVKVAVVDSGIDATHPDVGPVQGYVAIREDENGELVYDTEPHDDSFGHATACASVIRSLAPDCELYSVKVLGGGATCTGKVFTAGLRWAIDNGMQACNLSLGTTKREFYGLIHELADRAYFSNVVLVTAANNMPIPSFPSVYSSVISVAAHSVHDPYTFYYNPKPPVEFGALGIDVRMAWLDHKHITSTGNSYAAPHVTGLVTQILAKHPEMTVFQLKTILRELAANVDRTGIHPAPPLSGEGLVGQ